MSETRPQSEEQEFSLEEILAEFASPRIPEGEIVAPWDPDVPHPASAPTPQEEPPAPQSKEKKKAPQQHRASKAEAATQQPDKAEREKPVKAEREKPAQTKAETPKKKKEKPVERSSAPEPAEQSPAPESADAPEQGRPSLPERLLQQAREFSSHMFEQAPSAQEQSRAEQDLSGADDVEEEQPRKARPQKKREAPRREKSDAGRRVSAPPDTPPQDLAEQYQQGLRSLGLRRVLVLLLALPLLLASIVSSSYVDFSIPQVTEFLPLICTAVQLAALLLSWDLVTDGFRRCGVNTLLSVAALLTLADGVTMLWLDSRDGTLPYSLISVLSLAAGLWGRYMERDSLRSACRTAACAKQPYRVTLDGGSWDGRPAFTKWKGDLSGFGSQIQTAHGTARLFRRLTPGLLIGCALFSLLSVVVSGRVELLIWNLSATTCSCAGLAAALSFPLPYRLSTRRLAAGGAALAGWEGVRSQPRRCCILLRDSDMFPPGAVALNGVKIFPEFSSERVVSYAASLIRESGCELERVFYEYLRSQGAMYRRVERPVFYEGGVSAVIRTDQVLVGDASFMHLMGISLPQGLNVKSAVFCSINGKLAGIFALNYALHATVRPSLSALLSSRIAPVLVTRDFNVTPAMLTQRFKLPGDKLIFPAQERRRELSDEERPHGETLVCLVCREGIGPLAEAVAGAKRLNTAVRLNTGLAAAESIIGLLLSFYLTSQAAISSLTVFNLLVFHLAWLIPILLISGWINRY